jgi:TolA-binding protein
VDFPDAPFLDEMLLKWGVTLARMRRYPEAKDRLEQLLREYPNSAAAGKAKQLVERLAARM